MEPTAASRSSTRQGREAAAQRAPARAALAGGERGAGPRKDGETTIPVGRVVGAHGLRGILRVRAFADAADNLQGLERIWLGRAEGDPDAEPFDVRAVAPGRPGELRIELDGLRTRDAAFAQKGRLVLVAPSGLRALGPGEYYGYQLLGCRVEDEAGMLVGTLREIWETGASDLLVVVDAGGRQHLVPAALLRRVDVEARRVVVEILPGLLPAE